MNFKDYLDTRVKRIETFLMKILPDEHQEPTQLHQAMRYSVLNGGKRIRPLLVYATGEALGTPIALLDAPAAAVELIHCYSLIHDDLPSMDNDDLRRGKPSCHKAFDEATAILAGDALQSLAYEILTNFSLNPIEPHEQIEMLKVLTHATGVKGMVGGQALDMASQGKGQSTSLDQLRTLHQKKTGALIEASIQLGRIASGCADQNQWAALQLFGRSLGLIFQIQDDILDVTGDAHTLGKNPGKDVKQGKVTFPSLIGLEAAKKQLNHLYTQAIEAIHNLAPMGQELLEFTHLLARRSS